MARAALFLLSRYGETIFTEDLIFILKCYLEHSGDIEAKLELFIQFKSIDHLCDLLGTKQKKYLVSILSLIQLITLGSINQTRLIFSKAIISRLIFPCEQLHDKSAYYLLLTHFNIFLSVDSIRNMPDDAEKVLNMVIEILMYFDNYKIKTESLALIDLFIKEGSIQILDVLLIDLSFEYILISLIKERNSMVVQSCLSILESFETREFEFNSSKSEHSSFISIDKVIDVLKESRDHLDEDTNEQIELFIDQYKF